MSLDVTLVNETGAEIYSTNITHNLGCMADEAGIYGCLWHPEECGITHARQLVSPLEAGVTLLATRKKRFEAFNAPNGWGLYEHFLPWCVDLLQECRNHPNARVEVSR